MKIKSVLIYILCAIFIFQDALTQIIPGGFVTYFDEILVVILAIWSIMNIIYKGKIDKLSLKMFILLVLFSFIGIYSCYENSSFILINLIMSNFLSIKFFVVIISLMNITIMTSTINCIERAILFFSKIVMVFAVFNFIMPSIYEKIFPFVIQMYRFGLPSVCSLFVHPGTYGWFMLFISLYHYSSYLLTNDRKYFRKFVITAIFAILSFRVKVIMGIIAVLFYTAFKHEKISFKKIIVVLSIIMVILVSCRSLLENTYILYFTNEVGESARKSLTINSLNILRDYFPIGVGFGKFASWYARINYSEHYYAYNMTGIYGLNPENAFFATDTYWPSVLGETGFFGTVIFITLFIFIYRTLRRRMKNKSVITQKKMILLAILVLIQSLIESTSEAIYNNPPQFIFVACILGFALSGNIKYFKEEDI